MVLVQASWPDTSVTESYKDHFPTWSAIFGNKPGQYDSYEWKVYTTHTVDDNGENEWQLNFFQILARDDRIVNSVKRNNVSVLLMHGMGQDAETWLKGYFVGLPLPLKLADLGYTVYMGNNRGTKFSKNMQVADESSEAYWDFDFRDMGTKDLPALIHSINQLEGGDLVYIGYDLGNTQMFYGLTQLEDFYFNSYISSFVALAPCVLPQTQAGGFLSYEQSVGGYRDLGVYAVNGPNWADDLDKICDNLG